MTIKIVLSAAAVSMLAIGAALAAGAAGSLPTPAVAVEAAGPGCGFSLSSAAAKDLHIVYGCRATRMAVAAMRDYIRT